MRTPEEIIESMSEDELNATLTRISTTKDFVAKLMSWPLPEQCTALSMIIDSISRPEFSHDDIIDGLRSVCDGKGFDFGPRH